MRTYKLQIRIIQLAVVATLIIIICGAVSSAFTREKDSGVNLPDDKSQNGLFTKLENKKIVALGDSFTLGYPGSKDESWVKHLENNLQNMLSKGTESGQSLEEDGQEIEVVNMGRSRQTSKDLLDRFPEDVLAEKPGMVIIFAGNGDALQGVDRSSFQGNIIAMVELAKKNNIIPILALPLPYTGYTQEIMALREWESAYAQENNILILDFRTVLYNENNNFLKGLSVDNRFPSIEGKYPSAKGYEVMGEYAAEILIKASYPQ